MLSKQAQMHRWEEIYRRFFGRQFYFTSRHLPNRIPSKDFSRLIVVAGGLTVERVIEVLSSLCDVSHFNYYVETLYSARIPKTGYYGVCMRDRKVADIENISFSAQHFIDNKIPSITLLEHLLFLLQSHLECAGTIDPTSSDIEFRTMCAGSIDDRGYIPTVSYSTVHRRLEISYYDPKTISKNFRVRSVYTNEVPYTAP